jgi:hypothetical protein
METPSQIPEKKLLSSNLGLVLMSVVITPNFHCKIELLPLLKLFKLTKTIIGIKYGKDYKKGKVKSTTQGFYNSITFTITLKNGREASVKLCNDLVVHISGLKSLHEAYLIANLLYEKIIKKNMLPNLLPIDFRPIKHDIILMNSGYNANIKIDRKQLTKVCMEKCKYTAFFTPNSYSGVKIYPAKDLAILVFRTGKAIVTGARSMKRLIDGYFLIEKVFRKYYELIVE